MATPRPSTSYSTTSSSYQNGYSVSTSQTPYGRRPSTTHPSTGRRSRAGSTIGGGESQQIICAISEARGISPTVGLAFVNISLVKLSSVKSVIINSMLGLSTSSKSLILRRFSLCQLQVLQIPNPRCTRSLRRIYLEPESSLLIVGTVGNCWSWIYPAIGLYGRCRSNQGGYWSNYFATAVSLQ